MIWAAGVPLWVLTMACLWKCYQVFSLALREKQSQESRIKNLRVMLRKARPHVAMMKSSTSGRDFQLTTQVLLDDMDRELGEDR